MGFRCRGGARGWVAGVSLRGCAREVLRQSGHVLAEHEIRRCGEREWEGHEYRHGSGRGWVERASRQCGEYVLAGQELLRCIEHAWEERERRHGAECVSVRCGIRRGCGGRRTERGGRHGDVRGLVERVLHRVRSGDHNYDDPAYTRCSRVCVLDHMYCKRGGARISPLRHNNREAGMEQDSHANHVVGIHRDSSWSGSGHAQIVRLGMGASGDNARPHIRCFAGGRRRRPRSDEMAVGPEAEDGLDVRAIAVRVDEMMQSVTPGLWG